MAEAPRVLFLGMSGAFSLVVLESFVAAGGSVGGVLLPGFPRRPGAEHGRGAGDSSLDAQYDKLGGLPIIMPFTQRTIADVARELGIGTLEAWDLSGHDIAESVRPLAPDIIAVACWPRLIPRGFRQLAPLAVNVHPSLLPDNRGPAPVFWTLRLGQQVSGVTIHVLEDRADTGPILAQRRLPVPEGISAADLEAQLAAAGGELLAQVARDFATGQLVPWPQDEAQATYYPWPKFEHPPEVLPVHISPPRGAMSKEIDA